MNPNSQVVLTNGGCADSQMSAQDPSLVSMTPSSWKNLPERSTEVIQQRQAELQGRDGGGAGGGVKGKI